VTISVVPNDFATLASLRTFILSLLPDGVEVVKGQTNRVPPPAGSNYVVMTPTLRERLSTNVDEFVDTRMIGSIAGDTLTITEVDYGGIKLGSVILGVDVLPRTYVTSVFPGSGGTGVYKVTPVQSISGRVLAAGVLDALMPTKVTIQIDVHGPDSSDYVHRISTMFRDDYAYLSFTRGTPGIVPLYADDPKQVPFINDSNQYEFRWVLEACLQVNATVEDIPQEFFEQIVVGLINVDTRYPA
jgi:hypothetical protein